jgi:hemolysin activation/secretion protein
MAHLTRIRFKQAGAIVALVLLQFFLGSAVHSQQQAAAPAPKFAIERFEVTGNTLLTPQAVEQAVAPYTGKNKDFADVQRALEALELAYRNAGYAIVQVRLPEQDITRGVVQFRVLEQRVGRVTISGNKFFDADNVRNSVPSIREGATPNSRAMSRNLQMLAEHPTKQTSISLRSGASEELVDVNVRVTDEKPWRVFLTLDNTGSGSTGYFRSGIGYQHSNLFNRDHTVTMQYTTSPTHVSDVTILAAGYRIPFYAHSSSLDLIAGYSDVDSGTLGAVGGGSFNVSGSGTIAAVRWNHYLPKWGEIEQKLSLGLDYRAFRNEVTFAGIGLVPDITIRPASLTYSATRRFASAEVSGYAQVSSNLPGANDGHAADFERSRATASDHYTIVRFGGSILSAFAGDWQLRVAGNAQQTGDSLVPGEQFGIGGPDSVRGYLVRETASDQGWQGQVEVYTPNLASKAGMPDAYRVRLLGFFDAGTVKRNNVQLLDGSESESLKSAGLGLRVNYGRRVSARVDVAKILHDTPNRAGGSTRVTGALALVF